MDQHLSTSIQKSLNYPQKEFSHGILQQEQQYPETDALGVSLIANLPQERDGMQFPKNEALNITAFQPIAFVRKSLYNAEMIIAT